MISPTCSYSGGTGLGLEFRHADLREKVHDPTDNDQVPDVRTMPVPAMAITAAIMRVSSGKRLKTL